MAILSAGCDHAPPDSEPAVPPVTTDTDLTAPVNEAASNEAVIPVVPNPPMR